MAEDVLQPLNSEQSLTERLKIINDNFNTLTKRLASLNTQYAYLDMIRITHIFHGGDEVNSNRLVSNFITQTWTVLDNYAGAYIDIAPNAWFEFEQARYVRGDFILKLPGNVAVYIKGPEATIYVPTWTATNPFVIRYTATTPNSGENLTSGVSEINAAIEGASIKQQLGSFNNGVLDPGIPTIDNLISIRWYTAATNNLPGSVAGEEVVWTNSGVTINTTILESITEALSCTLNYRAIIRKSIE